MESKDAWNLVTVGHKAEGTIDIKFVQSLTRSYVFSTDSFEIVLDSLFLTPLFATPVTTVVVAPGGGLVVTTQPTPTPTPQTTNTNTSHSSIQTQTQPQPQPQQFIPGTNIPLVKSNLPIVVESLYGDYTQALTHLNQNLLVTTAPHEIRRGIFRYCYERWKGRKPPPELQDQMEKVFIEALLEESRQFNCNDFLKRFLEKHSPHSIVYLDTLMDVLVRYQKQLAEYVAQNPTPPPSTTPTSPSKTGEENSTTTTTTTTLIDISAAHVTVDDFPENTKTIIPPQTPNKDNNNNPSTSTTTTTTTTTPSNAKSPNSTVGRTNSYQRSQIEPVDLSTPTKRLEHLNKLIGVVKLNREHSEELLALEGQYPQPQVPYHPATLNQTPNYKLTNYSFNRGGGSNSGSGVGVGVGSGSVFPPRRPMGRGARGGNRTNTNNNNTNNNSNNNNSNQVAKTGSQQTIEELNGRSAEHSTTTTTTTTSEQTPTTQTQAQTQEQNS